MKLYLIDEEPVKLRIKDTKLRSKPPPVPPRNRPSPIGQHSNQPRTERVLTERNQNSPQKVCFMIEVVLNSTPLVGKDKSYGLYY